MLYYKNRRPYQKDIIGQCYDEIEIQTQLKAYDTIQITPDNAFDSLPTVRSKEL